MVMVVEREQCTTKQAVAGKVERFLHHTLRAQFRLSERNRLRREMDRPRRVDHLACGALTHHEASPHRLMTPNDVGERSGESRAIQHAPYTHRKPDVICRPQPTQTIEKPESLL